MSLNQARRQWLRRTLGTTLAGSGLLGAEPLAWAAPRAGATALGGAPATGLSAALNVPAMHCERRTLANGLEVLWQSGSHNGRVSVQVWYRVGGKDDPEGRSGFAHLFEHLMFKGTRHMAPEQMDRLTEDVGGHNNAFTSEDVTVYQNEVPSHHLERILWAEAERMASLKVDEANFKSERAVVQEEYRQRVLAAPYGRLFDALPTYAFRVHPYRRPVIGSIADLDAATLDDVRAFHATYYRPDNAILIVSGDFVPAQLHAWVDRYFGLVARPATPVPRVNVVEPAWTASPAPQQLTAPNVPLPAQLLLWQGVPASSKDATALSVAQALLAGGESSRLNEALVHRQQVAQTAGFDASCNTDAGYIAAYAIAAGPRQPDTLVAPLMHELERLAHGPLPAAELDKVKTQMLTQTLNRRQTAEGRVSELGWAMIHDRDPEAVNRDLAELLATTADDVRRVLHRHVLGRPMLTLSYRQGA